MVGRVHVGGAALSSCPHVLMLALLHVLMSSLRAARALARRVSSIYAPCMCPRPAPPCAAPRLHLLAYISLYPRICAYMHLYGFILSSPLPYAYLILSRLCKSLVMPTFDALVLCVIVCISSNGRGTVSRPRLERCLSCPPSPPLSPPHCSLLLPCPSASCPINPRPALYPFRRCVLRTARAHMWGLSSYLAVRPGLSRWRV